MPKQKNMQPSKPGESKPRASKSQQKEEVVFGPWDSETRKFDFIIDKIKLTCFCLEWVAENLVREFPLAIPEQIKARPNSVKNFSYKTQNC